MTGLWLLAGPLVAAAVGLAVGGRWPRLVGPVAVTGTTVALVLAVASFAGQRWSDPVLTPGLTGRYSLLPFATVVDGLSASVAVMVALVALLVQVYSTAYMRGEARYASYAAFVSLFTAAMLAVVVAGDLLFLVVGWEVMGLCSYLLIGQHWEQEDARRAAVKAFLVTKLGDVGFLLGVVVIVATTGTTRLVPAVTGVLGHDGLATPVTLLLLLGVLGKSAQFPLHAWLPDAMAGPSPVSALIHAATMVAAGIYVVARLYPLFLAAPLTLGVMAVVASVTMLGAALAAVAQGDLKRVLAWSTVSQLAYMLGALAVGSRDAAVFQMLSHAFFKALLFLAAGAVIHTVGSNAMASMGGLRLPMPVTFWTMTVGLASLAGVPPLSGFFGKESVLSAAEHTARGDSGLAPWTGWLVLAAGLLTVAVTGAYATRLWRLTFLGSYRGAGTPHEAPPAMRWPLVALAVPSAAFGLVGLSASWLPQWVAPSAFGPARAAAEALAPQPVTTALSLLALGLGAWAAWSAAGTSADDPARRLGRLEPVLADGFGVDTAYRAVAVLPFLAATRSADGAERRLLVPAVRGSGEAAEVAGRGVSRRQDGNVQHYLNAALVGVAVTAVVVALVAAA